MGFLMSNCSFWAKTAMFALLPCAIVSASPLTDDYDQLTLEGHLNNLYKDVSLPSKGSAGSTISWKSSDTLYMSNSGHITARDINENHPITLTATLSQGGETKEKKFEVSIHGYEPYSNYLFIYFPANNNENIYYAISNDGYNFTPMNNGNRVIAADSVSIKKGLRDPHILRAPDGAFYMVHTDMKSSEGWSSNRGMVLMKSRDLIHWTHSTVHFPDKYKGTNFAKVTRVWAPETIWDENYVNADGSKGRLMIYFSILEDGGNVNYDKVFYAYANDDFTDLIGEPTYFYDRGSATIDMDIVYNPNDRLYHAFYKNEGQGGICKVTAQTLTTEKGKEGSQWSKPSGTLQQTDEAVEGAGVFKLINQDSWILMYDCYNNGHYQFTSSPDLTNFKFVQNTEMKGAFTPRHGTVIPISAEETAALMKAFPTPDFTPNVIEIPDTLAKTANGKIVVGACATTKITSYAKIGDAEWEETTEISIKKGETVSLGPHPWDGKIWEWNGPDGYSSTDREIKFSNMSGLQSGYYTVKYTNETNCTSELKIKIVVDDPDHPYIEPVEPPKDEKQDSIKTDSTTKSVNFVQPVKPRVSRVVYFNANGALLKGVPNESGIFIRKEFLENGLVKVTRIRK